MLITAVEDMEVVPTHNKTLVDLLSGRDYKMIANSLSTASTTHRITSYNSKLSATWYDDTELPHLPALYLHWGIAANKYSSALQHGWK